jgi:hemerythrin
MPLVKWNDKFSVGVAKFDEEHQRLFAMVNDLFDGVNAGRGKDVLASIAEGLIAYARFHLANEERLLAHHGYPGLEGHKAQHRKLTRAVQRIQERLDAGATDAMAREVVRFLNEWLVQHILGTDKAYSAFLNGKGIT